MCYNTPVWIIALLILGISIFSSVHAQIPLVIVEAETGVLSGTTISTTRTGFTGSGYVRSFDTNGDMVTVTVHVPQTKFYRLEIRYCAPSGRKYEDILVNGIFNSSVALPGNSTFQDLSLGSILLNQGNNTISVRKNWGYSEIDRFRLFDVAPINYTTTDVHPINPNINNDTRQVYNYLRSQYGQKIISGQTTDYYDQVTALAGAGGNYKPVVRAFDFQNYSPMNPWGWNNGPAWGAWDDGTTQSAIDWYNTTNKNGIVTFQWHWFSPFGGNLRTSTFYSNQTTFDVRQAVIPGTPEFTATIRDIDAIAVQLKRLQTANVPVLWRPLHEAGGEWGGEWFWWGKQGPAACLSLYDTIYNRLTHYHKLNNLIWVWSTPEPNWYPGHDKVDIIGYDSYPGAYNYTVQKLIFDQLYDIVDGRKMIAMTENGPIPSIDDCYTYDAIWSFFMSWADLVLSSNSVSHVQNVFAHSNVITLNESTLSVDFLNLYYNNITHALHWTAWVHTNGSFVLQQSSDGILYKSIDTLDAITHQRMYQWNLTSISPFYYRIQYQSIGEQPSYSKALYTLNNQVYTIVRNENKRIELYLHDPSIVVTCNSSIGLPCRIILNDHPSVIIEAPISGVYLLSLQSSEGIQSFKLWISE
ncbi:MAG: hypothetical protein MUE33_06590 [Cytophagaceae bacterium]|nr:hypothetical protein [Cytophagaceae bacterium]